MHGTLLGSLLSCLGGCIIIENGKNLGIWFKNETKKKLSAGMQEVKRGRETFWILNQLCTVVGEN